MPCALGIDRKDIALCNSMLTYKSQSWSFDFFPRLACWGWWLFLHI